MQIGLDFGTTNCAAGWFDGQRVRLIPLEPGSDSPLVMRSVLYLSRDQRALCGQQAIEAYQARDASVSGARARRYVGEVEMTFAEVGAVKGYPGAASSVAQPVYALVGEDDGRLLSSLKSELASHEASTRVAGRHYALEELIATILEEVRVRVEAHTGQPVRSAVIGRPVHFSGAQGPEDDALAEERLRRAAELAGLGHTALELEPVAAARAYAQGARHPRNILVFDFGGGTLDLTVMHLAPPSTHQVLASGGLNLGGDALDRLITTSLVLDHLGRGSTWGADAGPFPEAHFDSLLHWQFAPEVGHRETLEFLWIARRTSSHPARIRALEALLAGNWVPQLARRVEEAKIALSSSPFAVIRLAGTDFDLWQPLTRSQFEALIGEVLHQVEASVLETLTQSGLRRDEIAAVVRTGGSSQIPCIIALLERLFGPDKMRLANALTSVAAGLSICAWSAQTGHG